MGTKPFTYEVDPNYDYVLEEKGNSYTALRKIKWGDSDQYKLDIRKYYAVEEGERMSKGCSLMSKEGADELAKVLIETGYGDDKAICDAILCNRPELTSRFINYFFQADPKSLAEHVNEYPVSENDSEDVYYDLGGVF